MKDISHKLLDSEHAWLALLLYDLRDYSSRHGLTEVSVELDGTISALLRTINRGPAEGPADHGQAILTLEKIRAEDRRR